MNKLPVIVVSAFMLSACSTMQSVKIPENKVELNFSKPYDTVYRIIAQNEERCMSPQQISSKIFPDNKTATVTYYLRSVIGYTMDIVSTAPQQTRVDLYLGFDVQKKYVPQRMDDWVNAGSIKCKFNGYPIGGND